MSRVPRQRRLAAAVAAVVAVASVLALSGSPSVSTAQFVDASDADGSVMSTGSLAAPTNVAATDGTTITLTWTASTSTAATGYHVYRSTTSGTLGSLVATVTPVSATTWTDTTPNDGANYYVLKTFFADNWETGAAESVGTKPVGFTDTFSGASGPIGTTETGGKTWQQINGTWTRTGSGTATTTAALSANPMIVIDTGTGNVDITNDTVAKSGEAIYFRVQDGTNWLRTRMRQTSNTYYPTEYQHQSMKTQYEWSWVITQYEFRHYHVDWYYYTAVLQYEWRTNTYGSWTSWSTDSTTGCRSTAPAPAGTDTDVKQYQVVVNGSGSAVGCNNNPLQYKYDQQSRTRTKTTTYQWCNSGVNCGDATTGNTRYNQTCGCYWAQDGVANSPNDGFEGHTRQGTYIGLDWCDSNTMSNCSNMSTYDSYTGNTRQDPRTGWYDAGVTPTYAGATKTGNTKQVWDGTYYWDRNYCSGCPTRTATYTVTDYTYYLYVDKSVAGTITNLANYNVGSVTKFRVVAQGSTIQIYTGTSTLVGTVTDATFATATRHGVGLGGTDTSSSGQTLTNVSILPL